MMENYRKLFESYLHICQETGEFNMTSEELEMACKACNSLREQLIGMLDLMEQCGELSPEEKEREFDCILNEFSTRKLWTWQ